MLASSCFSRKQVEAYTRRSDSLAATLLVLTYAYFTVNVL